MSLLRGNFLRIISPYLRQSTPLLRPNELGAASGARFLFSHEKLGIENFKRQRANQFEKLGNLKEKFCTDIQEFMNQKDPVVFTADLKVMVHMAEDANDIEILEKMIRLYQAQQTDLSFVQFNFGPLVIRLLHLLKEPQKAFDLFMDKDLQDSGFFDQMASQVVLLNLLYDHGMYDTVHEVMDKLMQKKLGGITLPVDCLTLALASCLKQNTLESYEKMIGYIQEIRNSGMNMSHRAIIHAAMLALKQDKTIEAVEILSMAPVPYGRKRQPVAIQNVKVLAYARVGKLDEALLILRSVLENDVPDHVKTGGEIFEEILLQVKEGIKTTENAELMHQYEHLEKGLRDGNHVTDSDFENYIFRTIISQRSYQGGYKQRQNARKTNQPERQTNR